MQILETFDNFLLKRKEISAEIESVKNPSFQEIKDKLSQKMNADIESIVIKEILGSFGKRNFKVKAFVYDSKEAFDKLESKKQKKPTAAEPAAA
jgi:ribosomal protein S24E